MTLAQPLLVRPENQRHVRELRHLGAERAIQQDLLRRVRDVIVAAHHVRDLHLHIVGHDGEVIGRMAVRSQDDEVFDVRAVELDRAVDEIVEARRAVPGTRKRTARGTRVALARGDLVGASSAQQRAVVAPRRARCSAARASPSVPPACSSSSTRVPLATRRSRRRAIADRAARDWKYGACGPPIFGPSSQSRPSQRSPSRMPSTISVRRSLDVGVFDAQHEHAAVAPGEEPVEERGARAADVQVAGRRGSEADAWGWHRLSASRTSPARLCAAPPGSRRGCRTCGRPDTRARRRASDRPSPASGRPSAPSP